MGKRKSKRKQAPAPTNKRSAGQRRRWARARAWRALQDKLPEIA